MKKNKCLQHILIIVPIISLCLLLLSYIPKEQALTNREQEYGLDFSFEYPISHKKKVNTNS